MRENTDEINREFPWKVRDFPQKKPEIPEIHEIANC